MFPTPTPLPDRSRLPFLPQQKTQNKPNCRFLFVLSCGLFWVSGLFWVVGFSALCLFSLLIKKVDKKREGPADAEQKSCSAFLPLLLLPADHAEKTQTLEQPRHPSPISLLPPPHPSTPPVPQLSPSKSLKIEKEKNRNSKETLKNWRRQKIETRELFMDPGRDQRAKSTHQAIFGAYGAYLVGSQGVQISQQQQWLASGASNPWMQHPVYATAGVNPMHGNAKNNALPTTFFCSYNTFHNKEMSLHANLGVDTSKGKSNQMSPALKHFVNTMSHDGLVSYMQLLLAAEQEGARYGSSQSQEDRLVRTESQLGHLKRSSQLMQTRRRRREEGLKNRALGVEEVISLFLFIVPARTGNVY